MSTSVKACLKQAKEKLKAIPSAPIGLEAEVLLAHILNTDRLELFKYSNLTLTSSQSEKYSCLIKERLKNKPVAYLTGKKEFMSLEFKVTPAVLIPRPETESLTEIVIDKARERDSVLTKIFEIGIGSGAIAVSLAKYLDKVDITAVDVSKKALKIAKANAKAHGVSSKISFLRGDLFEPIKDFTEYFDIIVSNPPYISSKQIKKLDKSIVDFEPLIALEARKDGLEFIEKIISKGKDFLKVGGFLALEIGIGQSEEVRKLIESIPEYRLVEICKDYSGIERVVIVEKTIYHRL